MGKLGRSYADLASRGSGGRRGLLGEKGPKFEKQKDGSILVTGPNNTPETYTVTVHTKMPNITGVRLEKSGGRSAPRKGPGPSSEWEIFVLSGFKLDQNKIDGKDKAKPVKLVRPQATFSQDQFGIDKVIDNNPETGWAIAPNMGKNQVAVFETQGEGLRCRGRLRPSVHRSCKSLPEKTTTSASFGCR